jgi:hypothetical protein
MCAMIPRRLFLTTAGASLLLQSLPLSMAHAELLSNGLDHIILGCKDLDAGIAFMQEKSGYRAAFGGSHPGRGTRNALLSLGNSRYLEILAPDPEQPTLAWHSEILELDAPLLIGWAIRQKNIESRVTCLRNRGIECIGPVAGSRARPDGEILRWKTVTRVDDNHGLLPFYIEWDEHSPHPSSDAPGACLLIEIQTGGQVLEGLPPSPDLKKITRPGKTLQLRARIAGLLGEFELTSKAFPAEAWSTR